MNICELKGLNTKVGELSAKIYELMGAFEYLICTTPHLYPADVEQSASATPILRLINEELHRIDELATNLSESIPIIDYAERKDNFNLDFNKETVEILRVFNAATPRDRNKILGVVFEVDDAIEVGAEDIQ